MDVPFVKLKKAVIGFLMSAILLAGCTATAPTEMETEAPKTEQEPIAQGQNCEETEIQGTEIQETETQGSFQGEDLGEISVTAPYAKAYYDFLQECISARTVGPEYRFALTFIDDNEIPELLLFRDDSHAAGVEVYTYNQDQIVMLGEFGSFGNLQYVEREGMILSHFMGQGEANSDFFLLEDGEARLVSCLHSWPDHSGFSKTGEYREFYEIDEIPVTEDVFQARWDELYDSQEYVLIGYENGTPLKETELLPTLAQAIENLLWKRDSELVLKQVSRQAQTLNAYAAALADIKGEARFSLIYLDDDDTPELVVFDGDSHIDGASLYVCEQGEAVYVGRYGEWGTAIYQAGKGIIFHDYEHGGHGIGSVHQIDGTEDILLQEFQFQQLELEDDLEEVSYSYWVDGREVSEKEYDDARKKWYDESHQVIHYDACTPIKCTDIYAALEQELQTLILTQYDVIKQNLLIKSGMSEESILMMNYDDYDRDGRYEAFVFCGESYEELGNQLYDGALWFVGEKQCTLLRKGCYRMIDGQMKLGPGQKYLYLYSDEVFTANISDLWTVENGEPVESEFSRMGMVISREGYRDIFEIVIDSYDNYYHPADELWTGHTYKPYFYYYDWSTRQIREDESEILSSEELEQLCGFDLAAEVEAEDYIVTDIIKWKYSNIVAVNYTIPAAKEDPYLSITYENIIWDCNTNDYWRSAERGVTSWRNAGEGGSFHR